MSGALSRRRSSHLETWTDEREIINIGKPSEKFRSKLEGAVSARLHALRPSTQEVEADDLMHDILVSDPASFAEVPRSF